MQNYLFVSLGAALGGALRYWISKAAYHVLPASFPFGTLAVNVIGGFIIGFVMYYLDANEVISPETRIFLTTGFCGGLTTFSTFSYETINLFRDSEIFLGAANILLNFVLSLGAVLAAFYLAKVLSVR